MLFHKSVARQERQTYPVCPRLLRYDSVDAAGIEERRNFGINYQILFYRRSRWPWIILGYDFVTFNLIPKLIMCALWNVFRYSTPKSV